MTIKQLRQIQAKVRNAKKRAKRAATKARQAAVIQRRKAKRAAKAAPRNRLAHWNERVRASGKCAVCGVGIVAKQLKGKPKLNKLGKPILIQLHAHHILPKERYKEFRFKKINGLCLCPDHHKYGKFSAHRNPLWFALWLQTNRPVQYAWAVAHLGTDA